MVHNDIGARHAKRQIEMDGTEIIGYRSPSRHTRQPYTIFPAAQPKPHSCSARGVRPVSDAVSVISWVLEPRLHCPSNMPRKPEDAWPPSQQIQSVDHAVHVSNTTDCLVLLESGERPCQARHILPVEASTSTSRPTTCRAASPSPATHKLFSPRVILDPDGYLDQDTRDKFITLNLEFDDAFSPSISKYNGASGKIEAVVNIGPTLPSQCEGRLPQYNRNTLEELQD